MSEKELTNRDTQRGRARIMADRVRLQQVFMNLILNGIEAMKETSTPGKLTITSQQDDNRQLLISVADTAVGLQPGQAEEVFNAFFTSKSQGMGMGLPISRSIIESHGGRLWPPPTPGEAQHLGSPCPSKSRRRMLLSPATWVH